MIFKKALRSLFRVIKRVEQWSSDSEKGSIYSEAPCKEEKKAFISVWDALQFKENTQAYHLNNTIGFEEWVDMEETLRRIQEIFGAEYKNTRSLYPYLKTLVDIGLMETTSVGGRRKWRKVMLLVPTAERLFKREEIKVGDKKKKKPEN